jgi:hypothetical protein
MSCTHLLLDVSHLNQNIYLTFFIGLITYRVALQHLFLGFTQQQWSNLSRGPIVTHVVILHIPLHLTKTQTLKLMKSVSFYKSHNYFAIQKLFLCLIKHHAMKKYRSAVLDLRYRWRRVVSFTSRPLYQRKISCPCLESNLGHPARRPSLCRLTYTI